MAVDRPVIDIDLVIIGRIHQVIAAFDITRTRGQGLQDQEFGDGQRWTGSPSQEQACRFGSSNSLPRSSGLLSPGSSALFGEIGSLDERAWQHRLDRSPSRRCEKGLAM